MSPSPRLSRCLVAKSDRSFELYLDEKPANLVGDYAEFIQALKVFPQRIIAVHLHNSFVKELSESQKIELFQCLAEIEELTIASATISAYLLTKIFALAPHMQKLSMDRVVFFRSAQEQESCQQDLYLALQCLTNLEELHLCISPVTFNVPEGMRPFFQQGDRLDSLFHALSNVASLKKFYLAMGRNSRDNYAEPETLKTFVQSSVEDLTLVNLHLNVEQCAAVADPSLLSLSLINAGLGPEGALIIAQALRQMTRLQKLYLPENKMMNSGAIAIAQTAGNLQVLDLHDNNLGPHFAKVMAANLGNLEFLDISCNPLGDCGARALALALTNNHNLEQLNLYDTNLTNKSCRAFAVALGKNQTIKRMNLYKNKDISTAGVHTLIQCLEYSNYSLERLEVSENRELGGALEHYLKLNREFGRRQLLAETTRDDRFFQGIQQAVTENDLSSIYYLLQQRPSLYTSLKAAEATEVTFSQDKLTTPALHRASLKDIMFQGKIFANPQA